MANTSTVLASQYETRVYLEKDCVGSSGVHDIAEISGCRVEFIVELGIDISGFIDASERANKTYTETVSFLSIAALNKTNFPPLIASAT